MGINSIPSIGLGAKERLGSPGTLAGMAPAAETNKSSQVQPAQTNARGEMEFSSGRGIVTTQPTREPTTPLSVVADQVRSGYVDARA